jgi:hypothetical protein
MKRGGPLRRTAPLRTRAPFVGSTPMQRAAGLARRAVAAKRAKVTPAERDARKVVASRSFGRCELNPRHPGTDMHHRLNRSQGGRWCPANLMHLCADHHRWITEHPNAAAAQGWTIHGRRNPADVPCWLFGREFVFLTPTGQIIEPENEAA